VWERGHCVEGTPRRGGRAAPSRGLRPPSVIPLDHSRRTCPSRAIAPLEVPTNAAPPDSRRAGPRPAVAGESRAGGAADALHRPARRPPATAAGMHPSGPGGNPVGGPDRATSGRRPRIGFPSMTSPSTAPARTGCISRWSWTALAPRRGLGDG
jgi:hypothetical protein